MHLKESGENYLEALLILKKELGNVRSIDVAHHLNVSKPSVSVAMKHFREDGYVIIDFNNINKKLMRANGFLFLRNNHFCIAK